MAPVQALEKELGVAILPLAQNDPALSFNCVNVADKFGDAELAKFAPVADRMSEVNLGRSKVTDAGLASLAGMKNLKKLHLPNTAVTDAGIDSLLVLANLEYLNLFNTKITDAGLAKLEKLPNLKRLFVWQTGATKPAAEALHAKLPGLVINLGWDQEVKTVVAAVAAPAAPTAPTAPAAADPEKAIYETLIHPIFAAKCISCHGEEKSKGKLKMHTFAELMKNGDSGEATVVAGKAGDSLIIKRALLPLEEDEHMPPSNKDQLSEKELAILKWWIDGGAKTDLKLKDAALPENLK
jgi:mono/diheme cytochrome c family protein